MSPGLRESPLLVPFLIVLACLALAGIMMLVPQMPVHPVPEVQTITLTVPFPPIPVASERGINLAYELEIEPGAGQAIVPERIEVLDPATGSVLFSAEGDVLSAIYHPAADPPPTAAERQNGTGKLVFPRMSLWVVVENATVPDRLVHRLTLNRTAGAGGPAMITGADIAVLKNRSPVVVGSPVYGPGWLATETTSLYTHHFLTQVTLGGVTRVPQRYAQDWIYMDPATGKVVSGNTTLAKNYLGYGREIHAVSNGTVVDCLEGIPDNEIIYVTPSLNVSTAPGNYIIVDMGNGMYACYAHMVPGSLTVKKGDRVTEGQLLGRMGNSGNSDLPHLHFQVSTGPSFLEAEGYPHVYRSFDVIGRVNESVFLEPLIQGELSADRIWDSIDKAVVLLQEPEHRENMLMENFGILRLPPAGEDMGTSYPGSSAAQRAVRASG